MIGGAITKNPISQFRMPCSSQDSSVMKFVLSFTEDLGNPSRAGWDHVEIKFFVSVLSNSFIHIQAQLTFDKWMNTPMQYSVCKSWLCCSWRRLASAQWTEEVFGVSSVERGLVFGCGSSHPSDPQILTRLFPFCYHIWSCQRPSSRPVKYQDSSL